MNTQRVVWKFLIISILIGAMAGLKYDFWTIAGLAGIVFVFLLYVNRLRTAIPVLELMLLISALQWIYGAHQAFDYEFQHDKYYMYVEREPYMAIVVPGFFAFMLGVMLIKKEMNIADISKKMAHFVMKNPRAPLILVGIGFISPFIQGFAPAVIGFVFYLTSNLKYIGAALWLFKPHSKNKWLAMGGILMLTMLSSIQAGMFHDLLLWSALLFSFVVLQTNMPIWRRLVFIVGGFFLVFLIQSVKGEFRERMVERVVVNQTPMEVFQELIADRIENLGSLFNDEEYMAMTNVRLNQGWIISAIIENVPAVEPYADGETIIEAFSASLLPRFLDPDKKIAGGRENFERFTGLPLGTGTSMGTSVIGEAYANFGPMGAWIFMFLWGLFLSLFFNLLVKYAKKQPLMYVFLPLIFLQVVKAETELYVALNHFLKSLILVFILLWFFKKYLGWELKDGDVEMGEEGSGNR
jgi:hypothetical protein